MNSVAVRFRFGLGFQFGYAQLWCSGEYDANLLLLNAWPNSNSASTKKSRLDGNTTRTFHFYPRSGDPIPIGHSSNHVVCPVVQSRTCGPGCHGARWPGIPRQGCSTSEDPCHHSTVGCWGRWGVVFVISSLPPAFTSIL